MGECCFRLVGRLFERSQQLSFVFSNEVLLGSSEFPESGDFLLTLVLEASPLALLLGRDAPALVLRVVEQDDEIVRSGEGDVAAVAEDLELVGLDEVEALLAFGFVVDA